MDTKTQATPIFRNKHHAQLSEHSELKHDFIKAVEQIQELSERIAELEKALEVRS